jgi:hypothetical protein
MTAEPSDSAEPGSAEPGDAEHQRLLRELAALAENVLERVEPALRRAAAGVDSDGWAGCDWCPVCAALALLRGEHHDLLAALAEHGVAVVTVLREALAGAPVDPAPRRGEAAQPPRPGPAAGRGSGTYQPIRVTVK